MGARGDPATGNTSGYAVLSSVVRNAARICQVCAEFKSFLNACSELYMDELCGLRFVLIPSHKRLYSMIYTALMDSAVGRCHDNAKCESMWAITKQEIDISLCHRRCSASFESFFRPIQFGLLSC